MALMANTSIAKIAGMQPVRSRAKLNTEAVDTKELAACIQIAVFAAQSWAKHMEAVRNKAAIKSHESTVVQPTEQTKTHMDCTLDLEEYQYSIFLAQSKHCTRSQIRHRCSCFSSGL